LQTSFIQPVEGTGHVSEL